MKGLVQVYRGRDARRARAGAARVATAADARIADEIADTDYARRTCRRSRALRLLTGSPPSSGRSGTSSPSRQVGEERGRSRSKHRSTATIATNEYKHIADLTLDPASRSGGLHGGEINQVLLNLIVNAAHAIGDVVPGRRTSEANRDPRTWQGPRLGLHQRRDTGAGIPDDIRDKDLRPVLHHEGGRKRAPVRGSRSPGASSWTSTGRDRLRLRRRRGHDLHDQGCHASGPRCSRWWRLRAGPMRHGWRRG